MICFRFGNYSFQNHIVFGFCGLITAMVSLPYMTTPVISIGIILGVVFAKICDKTT